MNEGEMEYDVCLGCFTTKDIEGGKVTMNGDCADCFQFLISGLIAGEAMNGIALA